MKSEAREAALASLAGAPAAVAALVAGVPEAVLARPADGDWAPRDVVAHLVVSSRIGAIARIRAVVAEDEPALQNHDEDAELRRSGLRARAVAETLDELQRRRAADIAFLRTLGDAAYARAGMHSAVGRVTAEEFLFHAAYHDLLHVAQLARMLGASFDPLRGPMHVF